jgi:peptidoglycan hydrolase-like protein with peptidoglycan-binding domain
MKHWYLIFCFVIASLFGSVGEGFASCSHNNKKGIHPKHCVQGFVCLSALMGSDQFVKEANRRGLTCHQPSGYKNTAIYKPKTKPTLLKAAFIKLPKDQRKLLQANLKDLGYYKSTIDGLYGRGTAGALTAYNNEQLGNSDLKVSGNASALVEAVLTLNNAEEVTPETPIVESTEVAEAEADGEAEPEVEVAEVEPEVELPENYQAGIDAYNSGDLKTAMDQAKLLAPLGNADAQFYLGKMYAEGKGTLQRNTHAHMWFNLASANGHSEAAQERDVLAEKMTPVLVDKAQDLAAACMDSDYQDCALGKKTKPINKDQSNNLIPMTYSGNDKATIKESFRDQSLLRRKQIQYALRKLGYYTSSVDGLWGKGTERAVVIYGQDEKLGLSNPSEIFASALSRVDVPNSFAVAQPEKKLTVERSQPSQNEYAESVCESQANLARRQAKRNYRPSNTSFTTQCRRDFFGDFSCSGSERLTGGKWGGILASLEKKRAGDEAYETVLQSCMADYSRRD